MNGVFEVKDTEFLNQIKEQAANAVSSLIEIAGLKKGNIFVIGCSSSEVLGEKIGTNSSLDVANALFDGIYPVLKEKGIYMAVQCCEHLNRAIVIEKEACEKFRLEPVNARPQAKAGGSFATVTYERLNACLVETVSADAGIDIGLTMIGMHLKKVAVPVRLPVKKIGNAPIVCARTRPKFIGGERADYDKNLL